MESLVPAPVRGTLAHGAETEAAVKSSVQINSHNIAATKPHKAVCKDDAPECDSWAGEGFCVAERTRRQRHMKKTLERICRKSCGFCAEETASVDQEDTNAAEKATEPDTAQTSGVATTTAANVATFEASISPS